MYQEITHVTSSSVEKQSSANRMEETRIGKKKSRLILVGFHVPNK